MSLSEAAAFHDVRPDTVKSWSSGRNNAPQQVLDDLVNLAYAIENGADEAVYQFEMMTEKAGGVIEIGFCADDHEAQSLGLPFKSCHDQLISRLIFLLSDECIAPSSIKLVPRGSTLTTAAAADVHEKKLS